MGLLITLAPLVLGLAAWVLAGVRIFKKGPFLAPSWCACAFSLFFPLLTIDQWAQKGDTAAILDCVHAYALCAGALLLVNLLLCGIAVFVNRRKK